MRNVLLIFYHDNYFITSIILIFSYIFNMTFRYEIDCFHADLRVCENIPSIHRKTIDTAFLLWYNSLSGI